ncbi:MAG: alcohol dehydrogenase [Pseudomonadota bacterium]|jgi:choline dehydrogenase-like flavoprotein
MPAQDDVFDVVIVGAGTAGCVLAARLSEDPHCRVALLEAGARDRHPFFHVPALVGAAIARPASGWGLWTEPQRGLDGRRVPLPRGKVVGGSGSINGMAYFRGQPADYDDWAAAGNAGWGWSQVLPYFLRSEDNADHRASPWHGTGGPIRVSHIPRPNALNEAFLEAFAATGRYPACADFTGASPEGYGLRQGTIRGGRRDHTARAFLGPALGRPNLRLFARTRALRVLVDDNRATGVEILAGGRVRQLRAAREVLLCGGAFHSPQLLQLSGIGPGAALQALGIEVRQDLPGVGAGLHDHPACAVLQETDDTLSYGLSWRTAHRALWNGLEYLFAQRGPLASNLFESTAFIRGRHAQDRPDLQVVFQPARRNRDTTFPLPLGHGFAISLVALYPRSRGRVSLASADPLAPPRIDPDLLGDPTDLATLLDGLRLARELFAATAFRRHRGIEVAPGPGRVRDADLQAYIRATAATVHHPMGSCRMGRDSGAVVDAQLRVHGIGGLRVVDASVFPGTIGGNTNAPVVMVAEKAADLILGRPAPATS